MVRGPQPSSSSGWMLSLGAGIRTRTAEGRSRATARGQHMSRPPALTPQQQAEARQRRADGATLKELAQSYNVGLATISRLMETEAA